MAGSAVMVTRSSLLREAVELGSGPFELHQFVREGGAHHRGGQGSGEELNPRETLAQIGQDTSLKVRLQVKVDLV